MGKITDRIKKFAQRATDFFTGASKPSADGKLAAYTGRNTTAARRAITNANRRYRHTSSPLHPIDSPELRLLLGKDYLPTPKGQGISYVSTEGRAKKEADRIAEEFGLNNKQRRRLRTKVKRRALELAA